MGLWDKGGDGLGKLLNFSLQDEFGATLSGMMGALAEIQKKGDSMLAGIRRQREVGVLMLMLNC